MSQTVYMLRAAFEALKTKGYHAETPARDAGNLVFGLVGRAAEEVTKIGQSSF